MTSRQLPLRDTYVSCSEPINPYHGNYVSVSLSKPWILNLPFVYNNLWDIQDPSWNVSGQLNASSTFVNFPQWSDICRNFIMPTYCVRTWGNGSYWWNPNHYYDFSTRQLIPLSRSATYPEAQMGDLMFMKALLMGMSSFPMPSAPSYSEYGYNDGTENGDFYKFSSGSEFTIPLYGNNSGVPFEYLYVNNTFYNATNPLFQAGLGSVAGLNLTMFVIEPVVNLAITPFITPSYMSIYIRPLVPFSDLSGCFLKTPVNYSSYTEQYDWDGKFLLETTNGNNPNDPNTWGGSGIVESILPAIKADFAASTCSFTVVLPVQLYTAIPCAPYGTLTFSLGDVSGGSPKGTPQDISGAFFGNNMVTVAVRVRGTFVDTNGCTATASTAEGIQFEVISPKNMFNISHSYHEKTCNNNRPIFCSESIPIPRSNPLPYSSSILFSPKCGPGMWTNLPKP